MLESLLDHFEALFNPLAYSRLIPIFSVPDIRHLFLGGKFAAFLADFCGYSPEACAWFGTGMESPNHCDS